VYPYLKLSSELFIPTYFLMISLGVILSSLWFIKRAEQADLHKAKAIDISLVCLISGIVGARLLHVLFEDFPYYSDHPLEIFNVVNGGFVFLGGVLGALVGGSLYCSFRKEPFWMWADLAAPPLALGYAIGRLGCFLNGCCYGRLCDLPWAVDMHGAFRHPTQLYASAWESSVLLFLLFLARTKRPFGAIFSWWLVLHAIGRIVMENFRDDPRGHFILGLSIGIWMSTGLFIWGVSNLVALRSGETRKA
jgi:phosphatidylglycerol:prolipoprotein diacylglycerol transferase